MPRYVLFGTLWCALLLLAYGLFGIVNEKRAVVFGLPIFFIFAALVTTFFHAQHNRTGFWRCVTSRESWFRNTMLGGISVLIVAAGLMLIPSLKCKDLGGECFLDALRYASAYQMRGFGDPMNASQTSVEENTNIQMGRFELIRASFAHMTAQPMQTALLGYGASAINPSPWLGQDRHDILFDRFGIRGTAPSAISTLFESGFIGLIAMVVFFATLSLAIVRRIHYQDLSLGVGMLLLTSALAADYFLYSSVSWTSDALAPAAFVLLGLFLNSESRSGA